MQGIAGRRIVICAAGFVGALAAGWNIAQENYTLPMFVAAVLALWMVARWRQVEGDALLGGLLLVGYIVGNRGFAQLHVPGLPLLPAEAVLGLAMALTIWRCAWQQTVPLRRDLLNFFVLGWIVLGAARIPIDFRMYGFVAVRDFAMIYYALFFFLAQAWVGGGAERRWLQSCLMLALVMCAPVMLAFLMWPDWFASALTVAGIPLIYVKTDVAAGFLAAAVLWFVHRFVRTRQLGWVLVSSVAIVGIVASNSRAAVIALVAGTVWLGLLRLWKMLGVVAALVALGLSALVVDAVFDHRPLSATRIYRIYESAASIVDVSGTRFYQVSNLSDKPDNNQFRLVWWRTIVDQTSTDGAWFGLGFGHDLAAEFRRVYYGDASEDFSARSPHNFPLTVFGRMGIVGLSTLLAILVVAARNTWRAARQQRLTGESENDPLPLWLMVWTIFTGACFGVVLESPMGAVVFWTVLGFANAATASASAAATATASTAEPEETPASVSLAREAISPLPPTPEPVHRLSSAS